MTLFTEEEEKKKGKEPRNKNIAGVQWPQTKMYMEEMLTATTMFR